MSDERSQDELVALVAPASVGRLATVDSRRRPHVVPCCFALASGEVLYTAVDAKPKSTMALKRLDNIRANSAATLLVDHYDEDWSQLWWVRIDGDARVLAPDSTDESVMKERERALGLLAAKYEQYRHHRPQGAVIAIDARRWSGWWP